MEKAYNPRASLLFQKQSDLVCTVYMYLGFLWEAASVSRINFVLS